MTPDLFSLGAPREQAEGLVCSAKGCPAAAERGLLWNNPKIHSPERRKVWLACAEHRGGLGDFLTARGFLRDDLAVADIPEWAG